MRIILLLLLPVLALAQKTPFVLGETRSLQSAILSENRILNIYLPEGYSLTDTIRYPVIYLLDGSADEDFIHISGLVQFNSFEWVNRVPKSIVVGIATVDRRRDYTSPTTISDEKNAYPTSGKSASFIDFLEKELQPFINKQYKTSTHRTIIGQSLGGLLLTEIVLEKPQLFDAYIIVSPSIWWNNAAILSKTVSVEKTVHISKIAIFIAVGKEGLTPSQPPRVMEVDANLLYEKLKLSVPHNRKLIFDYLPNENHATLLHQAVNNAFIEFSK